MGGSEASNTLQRLVQASATLVQTESLLLGKPTSRAEIKGSGWDKLSADQCEHYALTGELPAGVTEEDISGKPTGSN